MFQCYDLYGNNFKNMESFNSYNRTLFTSLRVDNLSDISMCFFKESLMGYFIIYYF